MQVVDSIKPGIMPGAEPIHYQNGPHALLFFHGFTGSPYEGRPFADYFSEKGYSVHVPLLPGHGTHPEALEKVTHRTWLDAAISHYEQMQDNYEKVVVCGQSMGGALALHVASNKAVPAVITMAGALFIKDWRMKLLPVAKRILKYQHKSRGPDIRDQQAKAHSAAYPKYPFTSLEEFLRLIKMVRQELPAVTAPAMLIHSKKDRTIHYDNLAFVLKSISSGIRETLTLEDSYHVVSVDVERMRIFTAVERFLEKHVFPQATR